MYYSEHYKSPISKANVMRLFGVDPENDAATALRIGIYPVTPVAAGYTASHYRKESNNTYTAIANCVSISEMELVTVTRSLATSLTQLRTALGLPATQEVPQAVDGYYPLYTSEMEANAASGDNTAHAHVLNGVTYYMPNTGVTIYHGDYVAP